MSHTVETAVTNADEGLESLVQVFEQDGYVILEDILSESQVAQLIELRADAVADWCYSNGINDIPDAVGAAVERHPREILPIVADERLLGFAESVMGPRVQLDSAVFAGDPPVDSRHRMEPVEWHRDRFGFLPRGTYLPPYSVVCIAYLQEMTDEVGPLRVIPRSHVEAVTLATNEVNGSRPEEVLVRPKPGDIVAIHHNLLHSGTRNTSRQERRFFGFIYNVSSLVHEDNYAGPNCQGVLQAAESRHDRRILRLLGRDPKIIPRQNSGFTRPDVEDWAAWKREDALALQEPFPVVVSE